MSFAVARNTHEAFRWAIKEMTESLDASNTSAFADQWKQYVRNLDVHEVMESDGMFPLLLEYNPEVSELATEHENQKALMAAVDQAVEKGEVSAMKSSFEAWKEDQLAHLKHEEDIMMPITKKVGDSPQGRSEVFHTRVMPALEKSNDYDFHLGWVIQKLSTYGSASQPPEVAVRAYAHGLQHAWYVLSSPKAVF